jgi:hypothetical protein
VFLTGQVVSREQRRGRYTPESLAHPGKMLPSIARFLIATYTQPGEWVCDPMAGIATTIVEAIHLGRNGVGVEYEDRWTRVAADNLRLATAQGATGRGEIYHGDARHLPARIPAERRGRIALVITSPPYGPSTHGHVRTPGPRRGKVRKIDNRYGADSGNLAYQTHDQLAEGFTQILTGAAAILRPGGHVAITARPYRRHGELVNIPDMVAAAGTNAGLHLHEECAALIAGIRDGRLISRASFFQQKNVRDAIAHGHGGNIQVISALMPSVLTAVWSCTRPGRTAPVQIGRPRSSEARVALIVFCFFLPDTDARRPGRLARGRRTWISVPSRRTVSPSAAA